MEKYDHKKIEAKWQKKWEENGTYKTQENSSKPKQFVLDMFPYPSGEALHVGHPRGYLATDVFSRMKRMSGFNVLHPMGWDAFGLPAENYAIKNKVHPRVASDMNVERFKSQLAIIGMDYDWSREINTTDPKYYKWTQWMFLQMFKRGLAFESYEPINWCPVDKTGLANEDVEPDGTCERCGAKVEQKPMRQWVLKITDYSDRLLADLDKLPAWPEGVKVAQRNWIASMHDWVFSRQRYWGEPIPIIHCQKCGVVPVPEKDLPVLLPEVTSYEPTDTGESPLANIPEWVNVLCPTCGGDAKRETNTMPQWAGSSWYYLRYIDPNNDESFVDLKKEKEWMPVDVYVGGDHATRHLIYARFWHKVLFDIGAVSTEEPFPRLEFLGFILAPDGRKMSKRWKNVINPDEMIERFGADAFRLYEMFIGPFENTVPWNTDGLVGTLRFVEKVWRIAENLGSVSSLGVTHVINKTIKNVSKNIEAFKFNTSVSTMMVCANEMSSAESVSKDDFKKFIQLLAPFAPHVTEELWQIMGEEGSIHKSEWPRYDESLIKDDEINIAIQFNGKVRGTLKFENSPTEEEVLNEVKTHPELVKYLEGGNIHKTIYVKDKLLSIVI